MITTQKFNLDLSAPVGPLVLYAMQADSMSRFFAITVTDNGAAWTPPDGAAWTVRFGAPGTPAGWYDTITEPGGGTRPAIVVNENTATVEIAEQAVSTPGNNVLCVLVTDAQGYQIASWPFALNVQGVPGFDAPEATVYYNALTAQVAETLANAQEAAASAAQAQQYAESINPAQFATAAQGAKADTAVQSVNGKSGNAVTLAPADIGAATAAQGTLAESAVQSVNGKSGNAVTLAASDVGAAAASTSNLLTYTSVTQLGLAAGEVTTADVFIAMPNNSIAMLINTDVSDSPGSFAIVIIYRVNSARGRAFAYPVRDTTSYTMETNSGTGLTGEWVQLKGG